MSIWGDARQSKPDKPSVTESSSKYKDVASRVDTGFSLRKLQALQSDRYVNARYQKTEAFRRLKAQQLSKVLTEGGLDLLILDIRDEDAYQEYHVKSAVSYPARLFSRSHHPFTAQLLAYANGEIEGKLVVLYDDDERQAPVTASLLFEKGFDNIFVVTGGAKDILQMRPGLLEGEVPATAGCCLPRLSPEKHPPQGRPVTCKPGQVSVREISAVASHLARPITSRSYPAAPAPQGPGARALARQQAPRGLLGPVRPPSAASRKPVAPYQCAGPGDTTPHALPSQENDAPPGQLRVRRRASSSTLGRER